MKSAVYEGGGAPTQRDPLLDALRGFALLHMIAYHAVWDLVNLRGMKLSWFEGTPGFLWQQMICWSFILLSGFCWDRFVYRRAGRDRSHGIRAAGGSHLVGDFDVFGSGKRSYGAAAPPLAPMPAVDGTGGQRRPVLPFEARGKRPCGRPGCYAPLAVPGTPGRVLGLSCAGIYLHGLLSHLAVDLSL